MKTYVCSYWFKGEQYKFTIVADSLQDATWRLRQLKADAVIDGELMITVPIPSCWFRRLIDWWYAGRPS